jgi:hypothetical protein
MPANMFVQLASDTVNSAANMSQQNCVVVMLLSVLFTQFLQYNYDWPGDYGNNNWDQPFHRLHPVCNGFSVVTVNSGVFDRLALTLTNRWTMKVLLPVGEPKADTFYMALKANRTPSG